MLRRAGVPLSEIAAFLRGPGARASCKRWEPGRLDLEVASRRRALAEASRPARPAFATATGNPAGQDGRQPIEHDGTWLGDGPGEARAANRDAPLVSPPLFAVADGMSARPGGEIASRLALDTR
mgnify:FL=1